MVKLAALGKAQSVRGNGRSWDRSALSLPGKKPLDCIGQVQSENTRNFNKMF
jgi:hypothetical protein